MKDKEVYAISNEFEFDDVNENEVNDVNENEVNEPPKTTLRDFDDYPMDNASNVMISDNVESVVYNDQPYFEEPSQDNQNFGYDVCGVV